MGSMNFGLYPMLNRFKEFEHAWEREYLEGSRDTVFKNTYRDIETILALGKARGTKFEFECYDTSHLYNLAHFLQRGLVEPPLFVQTVYGVFGGIGTYAEKHLKWCARRAGDAKAGRDGVVFGVALETLAAQAGPAGRGSALPLVMRRLAGFLVAQRQHEHVGQRHRAAAARILAPSGHREVTKEVIRRADATHPEQRRRPRTPTAAATSGCGAPAAHAVVVVVCEVVA